MAFAHRPFAIAWLLLGQIPLLLLVPLVVLALRLDDERTRISAQLDAHAQSTSVALASYLNGVEGHLRVLARHVPDDGDAPASFLHDAQAVRQATGVDRILLTSAAGDILLQVPSSPRDGEHGPPEEAPFLVTVPVQRERGPLALTAHILPGRLLASVGRAGVPAGWDVRITGPDGRSITRKDRAVVSGQRLASTRRSSVDGWQTQVSAPRSAVYASLWQSAGRELLLLVLAVALAPPLAWQLVRSMRQVTASPDSELHHKLLHEVEARHQAIARELHDSVGSSLSGIGLLLSTAQHVTDRPRFLKILGRAQEQVAQSAQQVRQISRGMMPVGTEAGGLLIALVQLAAEIGSIHGVSCTVLARGTFDDIPAAHGTHLFRIVQEAAGNALRHGRARRVRILLARAGMRCRLSIVDDGHGCRPEDLFGLSAGVGMKSIRSRARAVGASLDCLARPGRGLRVRIAWLSAPSHWKDGSVHASPAQTRPVTSSRQAGS